MSCKIGSGQSHYYSHLTLSPPIEASNGMYPNDFLEVIPPNRSLKNILKYDGGLILVKFQLLRP